MSSSSIDRQGVGIAMTAFEGLGMAFRPQEVRDHGIDAHAELMDDGHASGRLLAVQLKSGSSYFDEQTEADIVFRSDTRHLDYWANHSLPVIVVLCDVESRKLYWGRVATDTIQRTPKGGKVLIPKVRQVGSADAHLLRDAATRILSPTEYDVLSEEDVSHGAAKRYCANVVLNRPMTRPEIAAVVRQVTLRQIGSRYYRDPRVERHWGDVDAHVVWTRVYATYGDYKNSNLLCRSSWIDPKLPADDRPVQDESENAGMSVMIAWATNYAEVAQVLADATLNKAQYLRAIDGHLPLLDEAVSNLSALLHTIDADEIYRDSALTRLQEFALEIGATCSELMRMGAAPIECSDLDDRVQALAGAAHNAVLPFSELGQGKWKGPQALYITRSAVDTYLLESERYRFEREKV